MAAYGVDVLDPRTTPRRVLSLLEYLPPSARRPGEPWSIESELLAGLIDHVAELTWLTARVNGSKNAARPRPVPRPKRRPVLAAAPMAPLAPGPVNQRLTAEGRQRPPRGPVKHDSWASAIYSIAKMAHVKVEEGG
jgi:hypothetical protein